MLFQISWSASNAEEPPVIYLSYYSINYGRSVIAEDGHTYERTAIIN